MLKTTLTQAVQALALNMSQTSDAALGEAWVWEDYDSEGQRFKAFVALHELSDLAALIAAQRVAQGNAPSMAQRILGLHCIAFRDLQGLLLGIDDELGERAPTVGEWSVHEALEHIVTAEAGFHVVCRLTVERARKGLPMAKPENEDYDAIYGSEQEFMGLMAVPFSELCQTYTGIHNAAITDLSQLTDADLALDALYWETKPYSLQFRLGRFEDHLRQHTIQIDRTLDALGVKRSEGRLLARMLYNAMAVVEAALLGAPDTLSEQQAQVAERIGKL